MGLRFQHPAPVQPGALGNIGWREEENLARQGLEAAAAAAAPTAAVAAKPAAVGSVGMYTMEEVEQHATEESCWFVHEGKVRNMRQYAVSFMTNGIACWSEMRLPACRPGQLQGIFIGTFTGLHR
jgi:hypothetical protein